MVLDDEGYSMYTEINGFEWDRRKARHNARKHGVGFREAATVFDDPEYIITADWEHSGSEDRNLILGETEAGRVVVVAFTLRGESTIRLISARPATANERVRYYGQS